MCIYIYIYIYIYISKSIGRIVNIPIVSFLSSDLFLLLTGKVRYFLNK